MRTSEAQYRLITARSDTVLREAYEHAVAYARELETAQRSSDYKLQRKFWRDQMRRGDDFQSYVISLFKRTLDNAARTYKLITTMSQLMFAVGIGLVVFAALYGTLANEKAFALAFAGLGVTTFVAIFVVGPVDKAQTALSNLVQVEVGFMAAFEQIRMLANYAWNPDGTLDREKAERASALLYEHARETMVLLQRYLEVKVEEPGQEESVK